MKFKNFFFNLKQNMWIFMYEEHENAIEIEYNKRFSTFYSEKLSRPID